MSSVTACSESCESSVQQEFLYLWYAVQDPEASTEEQDELLVRQFQCLSDGLTDSCPFVRVVAAQGICTVLNLYWEIIPSATTAGYVSRLTGVHDQVLSAANTVQQCVQQAPQCPGVQHTQNLPGLSSCG